MVAASEYPRSKEASSNAVPFVSRPGLALIVDLG